MNVEQFTNQPGPSPVLQNAMLATDTTLTVTNAASFAVLSAGQQQQIAVQDNASSAIDIMIATAISGNVLTVTRTGTAIAHVAGAAIATSVTADILNKLAQNGNVHTASGNFPWPSYYQKKIVLNQSAPGACTVSVDPTALVPWEDYTLVDGAAIAETYAIIIAPITGMIQGASQYQLSSKNQAVTFFSDTVNLWIK